MAPHGTSVPAVSLRQLVSTELAANRRILLKIDVEGFETQLLAELMTLEAKDRLTLVLEVHEAGFNAVGDPTTCFEILKRAGAHLADLNNRPLDTFKPHQVTQAVATWA